MKRRARSPAGRSRTADQPAWPVAVASALAGLLLYLPTVRFPLLWDDPMLLQLVATRLREGGLVRLLTTEFTLGSQGLHTGYYRPLALLSLAVDQWLMGGAPAAFHVVNVLLHAGVCGLVGLLLIRLTGERAAALAGGLLFAAHPAHVEAVAFVSGRTDLWAALAVFAATALWLQGRPATGRPTVRSAVLAAIVLAGILCKEVAVLVLPAWALWDLLGVGRPREPVGGWGRRNGWWLAAGAASVAMALALRFPLSRIPLSASRAPGEPPAGAGVLSRLALDLKLLVLPWPLNAYYTSSDLAFRPALAVGAAAAVALFALAVWQSRRLGCAAAGWTALFLLPVVGTFSLNASAAADRFLYLPSFGLVLAASACWAGLRRRFRPAATALAAAALLACAAGTLVRSQVWSSELLLYQDMARDDPPVFTPHFNLGNELAKAGRLEEAERSLRRALAISPGRADGWSNLGSVQVMRSELETAEASFAEAVRLAPSFLVARENLAATLVKRNRPLEALQTLEANPAPEESEVPILLDAGMALQEDGRPSDAERACLRAVRAAPRAGKPLRSLGALYGTQGRYRDAVAALEKAVVMEPADRLSRYALGLARLAAGDLDGAERDRQLLAPADPPLAADLGARLSSARATPSPPHP